MSGKILSYVMTTILAVFGILVAIQLGTIIIHKLSPGIDGRDWLAFGGSFVGAGFAAIGVYWATHHQRVAAKKALEKAEAALKFEQEKHRQEENKKTETASIIIFIALEKFDQKINKFTNPIMRLALFIATEQNNAEQGTEDNQDDTLKMILDDLETVIETNTDMDINDLAKYLPYIPPELKNDILKLIAKERGLLVGSFELYTMIKQVVYPMSYSLSYLNTIGDKNAVIYLEINNTAKNIHEISSALRKLISTK